MKITHRDFYLEVTRKQDELCSLTGKEFWPEIKRLLNLSSSDGDVQQMFDETICSLGSIDNIIKDPYEQTYNDGWKDYARLAAMQYVFSLRSGGDRTWEGALSYAPVLYEDEYMITQDQRDNWLAGDAISDYWEDDSE